MKMKKVLACVLVFAMCFSLVAAAGDSYVVVKGDVLWKIARNFGTTWQELAKINSLKDPNRIMVGQKLMLPEVAPVAPVAPVVPVVPPVVSNVFTGTANGNNGPLEVKVTMDKGAIAKVEIGKHTETAGICDLPFAEIPATIVKEQSILVDSISGATNTSKAVLLAVENALTQAGVNVASFKKEIKKDTADVQLADVTCDVVVVGAGGAGMQAALSLKEAGKNVILVEKQPMAGGATSLAATYFAAVDTEPQRKAGLNKTIADFVAEQTKTNPNLNAHNYTYMLEQAQGCMDWLNARNANMTKALSYYQVGLADGSSLGTALVKIFDTEIKANNVDVRLNTEATELLMNGTEVKGVKVKTKSGTYNIQANYVVLATGGFASGTKMLEKYASDWAKLPSTSSVGATGDGLRMALEAGASASFLDEVRLNPSVYTDGSVSESLSACRAGGAIMVNILGKRFCDDYFPNYTVLSKQMMEQPKGEVYLIFDQKTLDESARVRGFNDRGFFVKADTIEELAKKIDMPVDALAATVKRYQEGIDTKNDEFGRTLAMKTRIDKAPYYAVKCIPGIQVTLGGVDVNNNMQVLRKDGSNFKGLYAVGEVANEGLFQSAPTLLNMVFGEVVADHILSQMK